MWSSFTATSSPSTNESLIGADWGGVIQTQSCYANSCHSDCVRIVSLTVIQPSNYHQTFSSRRRRRRPAEMARRWFAVVRRWHWHCCLKRCDCCENWSARAYAALREPVDESRRRADAGVWIHRSQWLARMHKLARREGIHGERRLRGHSAWDGVSGRRHVGGQRKNPDKGIGGHRNVVSYR